MPTSSWLARREPELSSWEQLLATCDRPLLISGEISSAGWSAIESARAAGALIRVMPAAERLRRAGVLAEIAWSRLREAGQEGAFPAERVIPIYLKGPG